MMRGGLRLVEELGFQVAEEAFEVLGREEGRQEIEFGDGE